MDSGVLNSQSVFESISPKVEFRDIRDHYSFNEDLKCNYSIINYDIEEGDRIAIFKLGWNFVKEYVLFEWVSQYGEKNFVTFNKSCLPRNGLEIYQFCFISGENNVLGASEPFQFCDKPKNYQSLFIKDLSLPNNSKSVMNNFSVQLSAPAKEDENLELLKIKEENELLRNTLKTFVSEKKNYDPDIQQLKKITFDLQKSLNMQQVQIRDLQMKLESFKSENKKLENDNKTLQRNYTTLKNKVENVQLVKYPLDFDLGELQSLPPFPFSK